MSYMRHVVLLVAFGSCFVLLWGEGATAQQPPPIERLDEPAVQDAAQLQLDKRKARRRQAIRDAFPPFQPPASQLPNFRPAPGGWQLGVQGDKTDTGILITSVVRGSPAERAGLRRGDRILTIGTERVGVVGNRPVPTRKVLRRQVDFQGDVLLLVQPRNNRGLINVSVRLDAPGRR